MWLHLEKKPKAAIWKLSGPSPIAWRRICERRMHFYGIAKRRTRATWRPFTELATCFCLARQAFLMISVSRLHLWKEFDGHSERPPIDIRMHAGTCPKRSNAA